MKKNPNWEKNNNKLFWKEVSSCEHVIQIYKSDEIFLDTLEDFVLQGIESGDCVVAIGTTAHLNYIKKRLQAKGLNIQALVEDEQLLLLDADTTLAKFMRDGLPFEPKFAEVFDGIIEMAKNKNRKVRAFGEMVAVLWGQGYNEATIMLEHLWNKFCHNKKLCLFCAYPDNGFTKDKAHLVAHICKTHSRMIAGVNKSKTEIYYRKIPK